MKESYTGLLKQYRLDMQQELQSILEYWKDHTVDHINGGFFGKIDNDNEPGNQAAKGSVLNSRILWTYSAAFNLTGNSEWLVLAKRAYEYIINHFIDREFGGIYWSVDYKGHPLETKKQVYALSFAIYGLSEYYKATGDEKALQQAIDLYHQIVDHSYEPLFGGYIEALTRDWKTIEDLRLSDKDANERKTMNTHLHVVEGFANLYSVWPDEQLKGRINELLNLFLDHIIDHQTNHLKLFFNDQWQSKFNIVSYGHDIEASWLLLECSEVIGDKAMLPEMKSKAIAMASAAAEGLDADGGLWYEYDAGKNHLIKEKHWWPQSEAMVGFFNAFELGEESFLQRSYDSWKFVQQYIRDTNKGEWYWGVEEDHSIMQGQDKAGFWKCPYHNSRACMEIISRVNKQLIKLHKISQQ